MTPAEEDIMWKMNGHELKEWKASGLSITAWQHQKKVSQPMTAEENAAHDEVVEKINDLGNDELLELYKQQVADPKCCWMFMASNKVEVFGNPYIACRAKEVIRHQQELAAERQAEFAEQSARKEAEWARMQQDKADRENSPGWGSFT